MAAAIYWFTGQPGAGKSTLAAAWKAELRNRGCHAVHLDGEELREMTGNREFSEGGRLANIRAGQKLAARLSADGIIVVASFVSPYRWLREEFKKRHNVVEVYVHTTEARGKEKFFVKDYEPPISDFINIDTTGVSVEECIARIAEFKPPTSRSY